MRFPKLPFLGRESSDYGDPCGPNFATNRSSDTPSDDSEQFQPTQSYRVDSEDHLALPMTSREALVKLREDIDREIKVMQNEFSKRSLCSWLNESISFKSELSKMRWPSVLFMVAHVCAHFVVAFILEVDNLAINWVGFQGFILLLLLMFNLIVNIWDTKLRYKELLMKSEQISDLIKRCSEDKHLINKWRQHSWKSASARTLFIPKSPCVNQALTYRDNSCLNLPDFLLVRGDIIHLYPGERAPSDCVSLRLANSSIGQEKEAHSKRVTLQEGDMYCPIDSSDEDTGRDKSVDNNNISPFGDDHCGEKAKKDFKISHARLKKAHRGKDFLVLNTPYLKSLRTTLQRSYMRPVNSIEKECFIVSRKYFETYVVPSVFILSTLVTAIHYGYLDLTDEDQQIKTISIAYLLLRPSLTIMPFLPWMFPCFWMIVNAYGSARLLCCAEAQRTKLRSCKANDQGHWVESPNWLQASSSGRGRARNGGHESNFESLLATPTVADSSDQNKHDENELQDLQNNIKFFCIFKVFLALIRGKSGHVWRSSSLLQVLGCLTSLCCIDKVGILSWSNPTPEKVFILNSSSSEQTATGSTHFDQQESRDQKHSLISGGAGEAQQNQDHMSNPTSSLQLPVDKNHQASDDQGSSSNTNEMHSCDENQAFLGHKNSTSVSVATQQARHLSSCSLPANYPKPEVLDVSQAFDAYRGYGPESVCFEQATKLQFDDSNWTKYINNLKPLGLCILLNNCCEQSFGDYFRFYKHISYESTLRCNLTPVVKRRCLCALPELIGFSRDAVKSYNYINQIGCYKLIDPSSLNNGGKLVHSTLEQATQLKLPFPNMISNLHQNSLTASYQIFSQGSGDIVLDSCAEYWDGRELMPLDDCSRKKIMDFYHRTSLTSYCSAFAYAPLLNSHNLEDYYIELPSESTEMFPQLTKLANKQHEEFLKKQLISLPYQPISGYGGDSAHHEATLQHEFDINLAPPSASSRENIQQHLSSLSSSPVVPSSPTYYGGQEMNPLTRFEHGELRSHKTTGVQRLPRRYLSADELFMSSASELERNFHRHRGTGVEGAQWLKSSSKPRQLASKKRKLAETLEEIGDQVFVGMVAMQYQCCPDFVALVEQLEHACIRFVHFSKENELRSRVFSEKMGLESGWNCHISLQSDQKLEKANEAKGVIQAQENGECVLNITNLNDTFKPTARVSNILIGFQQKAKEEGKAAAAVARGDYLSGATSRRSSISAEQTILSSWRSLPSLVMRIISRVSLKQQQHQTSGKNGVLGSQLLFNSTNSGVAQKYSSAGDELVSRILGEPEGGIELNEGPFATDADGWGSPDGANQTDTGEQRFESLAFDMLNRAKLPKGIENIRPHLETVDNIPLQVSLFTDCTPSLTKEMIEIMQDYGEIVCVIGSASSRSNTAIFLQANASIAIEPLIPQSCTQSGLRRTSKNERACGDKGRSLKIQGEEVSRKKKRRRRKRRRQLPRTRSREEAIAADEQIRIQETPRMVYNPRDRLGFGAQQVPRSKPPVVRRMNRRRLRCRRRQSTSSCSQEGAPYEPTTKASLSSCSSRRSLSSETSSSSSSASTSYSSSSPTSSSSSSSATSNSTRGKRGSTSPGTEISFDTDHRSDSAEEDEDASNGSRVLQTSAGLDACLPNNGHECSELAMELPEPNSLASRLVSLPCSYSYSRKEPVNLYSLIMEARHFTFKMKNTFVCMICFALSISSAQFLASILFLPPMLSSGLTIWLTVVVVPLMSFSLMNTKMDSQVMKIAVGKNLQLKPENITFFVICYLIKFIPSIIVVVLNFGLIIAHSCKLTGFGSSSLGPCWMFTYVKHGNGSTTQQSSTIIPTLSNGSDMSMTNNGSIDEDLLWSNHLLTAQVCAAFLMVLYFVVISSGFVHRSHLMWQRNPVNNRLWAIISLALIIGQVFYNQLVLEINQNSSKMAYEFLVSLPLHIWLISFSWPILVVGINLLVKRAEIKATIRQQRRARFDFNTKLGMNSPF